jgi:hypothetical protein
MTKIHEGIPVPGRNYPSRATKYPLADMRVGHTIFIAPEKGESLVEAKRRVNGSVQRFRKMTNPDAKFAVRTANDIDTGKPAVGVWRVA